MKIHVIRNNQRYGPYDEKTLLAYVNQGQILIQDKAIKDGDTVEQTVGFYLKTAGLKTEVANKGYIISQLKAIGSELIFPKTTKQGAGHVIILPALTIMVLVEPFIQVVVEDSITSTVMVIKHTFLKGDDVTS